MPRLLLLKFWPLHLLADMISFGAHIARGRTPPFLSAKLDALRMMPGLVNRKWQMCTRAAEPRVAVAISLQVDPVEARGQEIRGAKRKRPLVSIGIGSWNS